MDIDLRDPEVQAAATKIQASFRGHKAREGHKAKIKRTQKIMEQASRESISTPTKEITAENPSEEDIDIDLNDPEVGAAALKIQASFRGHKARTEVQKIKSTDTVATPAEEAKEETEAVEQPAQNQPTEGKK